MVTFFGKKKIPTAIPIVQIRQFFFLLLNQYISDLVTLGARFHILIEILK
jgi:hypothetical protein